MQNNKKNAAVLGFGRIGRIHAANIKYHFPDVTLKTVADPFPDKEAALALGVENAVTDVDSVFSDPDIDVVVICTPTDTHVDFIKKAVRAKKDVFCEKPVSHSPAIIDELIQMTDQAGIKVQIGFNRRFDPNFQAVKNRIDDGSIGTPRIIKITSRDPQPPGPEYIRHSGGLFNDMTIHDFDMVRFLGGDAVKVYAEGANLVDPEIGRLGDIDTALITITMADGAIANIDNCREAAYGYDQRVEVLGSKGCVQAENKTPNKTSLTTKDGVKTEKPLNFFLERYDDAYRAELDAFFNCLNNGVQPSVGLEDIKKALEISQAANESMKTGKPVLIQSARRA